MGEDAECFIKRYDTFYKELLNSISIFALIAFVVQLTELVRRSQELVGFAR